MKRWLSSPDLISIIIIKCTFLWSAEFCFLFTVSFTRRSILKVNTWWDMRDERWLTHVCVKMQIKRYLSTSHRRFGEKWSSSICTYLENPNWAEPKDELINLIYAKSKNVLFQLENKASEKMSETKDTTKFECRHACDFRTFFFLSTFFWMF